MKRKSIFSLPEIIEGNKYDRIPLLKEIPDNSAMSLDELLQKIPLEKLQAEIERRKNRVKRTH